MYVRGTVMHMHHVGRAVNKLLPPCVAIDIVAAFDSRHYRKPTGPNATLSISRSRSIEVTEKRV